MSKTKKKLAMNIKGSIFADLKLFNNRGRAPQKLTNYASKD